MGFWDDFKKQAAEAAKAQEAKKKIKGNKFSDVADRSTGTPACPQCGSTQFKAKRDSKRRAAVVMTGGLGLVATKQKTVQCVGCGKEYQRG